MLFRTHPLHRLLLSLAMAIIAHFSILGLHYKSVLHLMVLWDVFAITMLSTSWLIIFKRTPHQIRLLAKNEDGSLLYVYLIVLTASFASIIAVLMLMITYESEGIPKII